jgi:hypothetical protein
MKCEEIFASQKLKMVYCDARMAEWSKAVDLSPTISGCAGSNPAPRIFYLMFYSFVSVAQWLEQSAVNRKVGGSNPSRDGSIP